MTDIYYVNYYKDFYSEAFHTGSQVICDPSPTENTDDDWIFLVPENQIKIFERKLHNNQWTLGGSFHEELSSNPYDGDSVDRTRVFSSWKKREMNFILTISPEFYNNFKLATGLAQKLNLLNKQDRIDLFNAVVYDEWPEVKGVNGEA